MTDRVHYHPNLIFSVGTQVVTLVDIPGSAGLVLQPRGTVGVVVKSPTDLEHSYRVHEQARRKAATADAARLSRPTTNPRVKEALPTLKEMMAFLLSGHVGVHLGQLSSWRRMIGLPPLF
jgi:hypothetical protein